MTTKTTNKTRRAAKPKQDESANGNTPTTPPPKARRAKRELTLEEMSLRAYKMTYERLHGKGKKTAAKKAKPAPGVARLPKAA